MDNENTFADLKSNTESRNAGIAFSEVDTTEDPAHYKAYRYAQCKNEHDDGSACDPKFNGMEYVCSFRAQHEAV
jgi:hypothetical protein